MCVISITNNLNFNIMKKLIFTLIAITIVLAAIGQCETRKYISIAKKVFDHKSILNPGKIFWTRPKFYDFATKLEWFLPKSCFYWSWIIFLTQIFPNLKTLTKWKKYFLPWWLQDLWYLPLLVTNVDIAVTVAVQIVLQYAKQLL